MIDGGLSTPLTAQIGLSPQGEFIVKGANPNHLKISADAATGEVSGSFIDPVNLKPVPFTGALYQNEILPGLGGFFLGPVTAGGAEESGNVILSP